MVSLWFDGYVLWLLILYVESFVCGVLGLLDMIKVIYGMGLNLICCSENEQIGLCRRGLFI